VRLIPRLALVIGVAFLVPIAALGYGVQHAATIQVGEEVSEKQSQFVDGLALYVQTWLESDVLLVKQLARSFALDELTEAEQRGFVRLVLQQVPGARIAALVDESGATVAVERSPAAPPSDEQEARFLEEIPLAELREALAAGNDVVVGRPYVPPGSDLPAFGLAVQASKRLAIGVEIGLGGIAGRFAEQAVAGQDLTLLDDAAGVVLHGEGGLVNPDHFRTLTEVGAERCANDVRYTTTRGVDVIAACAFVSGPRWMVVLAEPTATTIAATQREIVATTVFLAGWGVFFAVVIVAVFGRQFVRPVIALKDAALTVADGNLGAQVERPEGDEIVEMSELATAFNYMSTRLRQNRDTIDEKNKRIEAFNVELQEKLDERTRELEEAQVLLIRSARLSAVGQMGAGLAHELNNPLAGILGMVQVVLTKHRGQPDEALLKVIEEQAQRCSQIVAHLLRFSRPEPLAPGAERSEWDRVDLREVLDEVLGLVRASFQQKGVAVEVAERGAPLLVRGQRAQLGQGLAQLLSSLRAAAADGNRIAIATSSANGQVELRFAIHGAAATGRADDWMASGMGFWVANRVFADHGGQLIEPTEDGASGARTWRVVLPEA
jgi:two-component system, NtrC family, sensor kinase